MTSSVSGCDGRSAVVPYFATPWGSVLTDQPGVSEQAPGLVAPDRVKANALKRFYVRLTDGSLVSGAAGFGHLWLALPKLRWRRVDVQPGMLQVTKAVDREFLVVRPTLQRIWRAKSSKRARQ